MEVDRCRHKEGRRAERDSRKLVITKKMSKASSEQVGPKSRRYMRGRGSDSEENEKRESNPNVKIMSIIY